MTFTGRSEIMATPNPSAQTGSQMPPDLEKIDRRPSHHSIPPKELLANEADAELLGKWLSGA